MNALLAALTFTLALCVLPISADYCYDSGTDTDWSCPYDCCYSYDFCCTGSFAAAYWYAWVIVVFFILVCVCICAGGGYGYRRYYVRRVYYPAPATPVTATVVTTQQGYNQYGQYQPGPGYQQVPGYQQGPPKYS